MGSVLFNMRMDEELKKDVEDVCKEMGITMTAAFTMLAKKISREKRIPFSIDCGNMDVDAEKFIKELPNKIPRVEYSGRKNEFYIGHDGGLFRIEVYKLED